MGAVRRKLWLCAAGLSTAMGCTALPDIPEAKVSRIEPPVRVLPASATAASPVKQAANLEPAAKTPPPSHTPPAEATDKPAAINLATALQLANARPLDVQIAGKQVEIAVARYDRSRLLWVPNLTLGTDYFLHNGPQQNFAGELPRSNRSSFMAGFGPNVVFAFSDAVYAPLAARQDLRARQAEQQASANDVTLDVAQAYFGVQQARGELAATLTAVKHAEELARKTTTLAKGLAPPAEANRANAELGRRKQLASAARERWRTASAELARLLRLDPSALVEPVEPPFLSVTVVDPNLTLDGLIPVALSGRPELAGNQAIVQATLARLKQEKIRPLVPSLAVRSVSTNPSGSLGYGTFGGGRDGSVGNFGGRFDIDMQLLWEFQALGLGNRTRVSERKAEHTVALLELFRTQDRIAAEVASAFAQVRAATERLSDAEPALREAIDLVDKTVEGLGQTRRIGDALTLVVRPQEAVAAVQAFAQASSDYFAAVADYNRAQFRLYRALGHPAQCLARAVPSPVATPVAPATKPAQLPELPAVPPVEAMPRVAVEPMPVQPAEGTVPSVLPVLPAEPVEPVPQPLPVTEVEHEWTPVREVPKPLRPPVVVPDR